MTLTKTMIDAIYHAECVLADYDAARNKGYLPDAKTAVFNAAREVRALTANVQQPVADNPSTKLPYGENVAAICASIHGEHYDEIYATCGEMLGGFPGIGRFCAEAADAFTKAEAPYSAGEDYEWIDAIDDFSEQVITSLCSRSVPDVSTLHAFADDVIQRAVNNECVT